MNEPSTRNATTMITQAMMHERSFVMAMTTMAIDDETMMAMPSAALIIGGFTAASIGHRRLHSSNGRCY